MKPSVVIVDDEQVICEGLERVLSKKYKTHKALSGQEAVDLVRNNSDIDVMLCDLKMPEMDGVGVIERVRAENKDIFIIATTAAPPQMVCSAMKTGANAFMCKPLDLYQLEERIENAIRLKKADTCKVSSN